MYVSLQDVDQTQFNVSEREGLFLITPRKDKHVWEDHELWYRSLLCDAKGKVVSCGLPKFMNYHERPEHHELAIGDATEIRVAEKLDGSLVIVSKTNGKVYIRTRGNDTLGEFHDDVMAVLQKYPNVLKGEDDVSMHFEYTSPANQIVVLYSEPAITLLSYVIHIGVPKLITHPDVLEIFVGSRELNVPIAGRKEGRHIEDLLHEVSSWKDDEGVVVSCHNATKENPVLFKVKSYWYLMMHALRYQMTAKKMQQLLILEGLESFQHFQQYLYDFGYDFEIAEILRAAANEFFDAVDNTRHACRTMSVWCRTHELLERGEFVRRYFAEFPDQESWLFHYSMASYDKKNDTLFYPYAQACGESVRTIKTWLNTPDLVKTLLKTPATFEEEEDA